MRWSLIGHLGRVPSPTLGAPTHPSGPFASGLFLESSRIFQITKKLCVALLSLYKPDMWAIFDYF
jgi:hypothetical protein